jgi:hypothetical protein
VEPRPDVWLSLLTVRLLGVPSLASDHPVLKALKDAVTEAVEQGWLERRSVAGVTRSGKPARKGKEHLFLTAAGESLLSEAPRAEVAAVQARTQWQRLQQALATDRQALREAVTPNPEGESKAAAEMSRVVKGVADLMDRLDRVEALLSGGDAAERVDAALAALEARVSKALGSAPTPSPAATPDVPSRDAPSLNEALRAAYRKFRLFLEYQNGLVDIPTLYHEVRRSLPELTVEELHRELDRLWTHREIELHVLNEVREAEEPEKGIRWQDKLYYFVFWKNL